MNPLEEHQPAPAQEQPATSEPTYTAQLAGSSSSGANLFSWFFLGMLLFSLYLLYIVFEPFLHSIIFGCVFAALCYPAYTWCLTRTSNRIISAFLILIGLTFLVILPIIIFINGLVPQTVESIAAVNKWLGEAHLNTLLSEYVTPVLIRLQELLPSLDLNTMDIEATLVDASRKAGQFLVGLGTYLLSNTLQFFLQFGLILLVMFFLLMDGPNLIHRLTYYLPLKPSQTNILIQGLRRMSKAVLIGGFAVAALQGVAGGVGFALVGIKPFFWGTVMMFAAFVPVVGTGLVWVPAVLFLLLQGHTLSALFVTIWCGIGVTSIDSFLRPMLVRGGANVPVLFIFLSILGGINVFGMLGLFYGPLILTFFAIMLDIYAEEYAPILQQRALKKTPSQEAASVTENLNDLTKE